MAHSQQTNPAQNSSGPLQEILRIFRPSGAPAPAQDFGASDPLPKQGPVPEEQLVLNAAVKQTAAIIKNTN
jgi:hypothetical protein